MRDIIVSVIVPVYKVRENLLRACLNSLSIQKYSAVEFLVIDDGSPDNCGEICDEYAAKDPRIRVFHVENGGVSKARNTGIKAAVGKYILFVDGDDQLIEGCLTVLVDLVEQQHADLLFFANATVLETNMEHIEIPAEENKIESGNTIEIAASIISNHEESLGFHNVKFGSPWGIVFNAEFLKNNEVLFPLNIRKTQDRIFVTRALSYNPNVVITNQVGYVYVENSQSICQRYNPQIIEILDAAAEEFRETIMKYFSKKHQQKLLKAYDQLKLDFFMNELRLYFFHKDANRENRYLEFKALCIKNESTFSVCNYENLTSKKKIILFFLKQKNYWLLYKLLSLTN